jgi:hypothetical protein
MVHGSYLCGVRAVHSSRFSSSGLNGGWGWGVEMDSILVHWNKITLNGGLNYVEIQRCEKRCQEKAGQIS